MTERRVRVGLADARVTSDGATLTTSGLGSCVAVAAYTPNGVGGLLHAMIPEAPNDGADDQPAKYVDTGVPWLLNRLAEIDDGEPSVKIAGGATMFTVSGDSQSVGERNAERATTLLAERGVSVAATDLGGTVGRSVVFEPTTGALKIRHAGGTTTVL